MLSSEQIIEVRLAAAEQLGKMNNHSGKTLFLKFSIENLFESGFAIQRTNFDFYCIGIGEDWYSRFDKIFV